MLEAFSMLKEEDVYLAIIGAGHDESMLKKLHADLGLEKVMFFPYVHQTLIAKILDKSNCCIAGVQNKSLYQYGLSLNKLNDYLLSGKPVVFACNFDNVVKDAGQFVIPSESPAFLAETILKVRNLDQKELEIISQRSKSLIKEVYDYEVVADKYLNLLESL